MVATGGERTNFVCFSWLTSKIPSLQSGGRSQILDTSMRWEKITQKSKLDWTVFGTGTLH
jgi:hypothetical protein